MIPLFKVFMPDGVMAGMHRTLSSGYIGEGPRVIQFERELGRWLGLDGESGDGTRAATQESRREMVAVSSGTAALHLALRLAGVGAGDTVVSTPLTCAATNMPIAA